MNVATLTIEMAANVARLQQDMHKAASTVDGAMGKIRKSADMAMAAIGAIGVGLSVAGLSNWVRSGINAADTTAKLAQKTGLLAKEVAGLQLAFDQGGAGDRMQEALGKLSMEASKGNVAFKAMGIQVTDTSGKLKSTRDLIGEVAGKFAGYADGSAKVALAQQLFGESGSKLIPVLNGGAKALEQYDQTARALGLTIDTETGKSAEQFNDTLDLLSQSTTGVATQLAAKLLPTLNAVASEIVGTLTDTNFLSSATDVLSTAFKGLYSVAVGVVTAFKTVGTALGGVGAAIAAVLSGDFGQVRGIVTNLVSDIRESWTSAGGSIQRVWAETANSTVTSMAAVAGAAKRSAPDVQALAGAHGKAASASKEHAEALKLEQQAIETEAKFRQILIDDELKQAELKASRTKTAREMLEAIERETSLLGLSKTEREKAIALYELERAGVVAGTEAYAAYADEISRAIDARAAKQAAVATADAQKKAYEDALKKQKDATKEFWSSVDNTAHDVFVSVANEGEGAFKRIGKTIKAAVLDMLYQITVKKWIVQISGSFGGGGSTGNSWLDLAQQAYSYYNGGGTAAATSAASTYGSTYTASGVSNSAMISVPSTGAASGAGGAAAASSTTYTSGGFTGYGYLGYAALIAAAVIVAEGLYDKGYTRRNLGYGGSETVAFGQYSSYTSDPSIQRTNLNYTPESMLATMGRELGDMLGVSEKWVDIFSGTTRMATLIGRKLKAVGVEADVAAGELGDVRGYAYYKGGVFRSNKTTNFDLDSRDAAMFQTQIQGWVEGTKAMARALGYSEEAIDSYTGKVRINLKGAQTSAEVAERYAEAQENLQYEMLNAASGAKLTKEAFKSMMEGIQASIQSAGISEQGIADILVAGMTGRLSGADVGAQLADLLVGGIYNGIASSGAAQIASLFMNQIMTPIFTAIAAGVPISQAVSAAAMKQTIETARHYMEAIRATFAAPEFQAFMQEFGREIQSLGHSAGSVATPAMRSFGGAISAASQAAQQAAQERKTLENQLLTLEGNTVELRRRERAALAPSNRALFDRVKALEDEKAILDERAGLQRQIYELRGDTLAIQKLERDALNEANRSYYDEILRLQKIKDAKDAWSDLVGSVRSEIEQLKKDILGDDSPAAGVYAQAQFAIASAQARSAVTVGDSEAARAAAERLPELARAVVDMAQASATSLTEYRIAQGRTLESLSTTQRLLADRFGIDIPGFAVGTNYVPRDMLAQIHEGEAIVPKAYNPAAGGQGELIAEVRALREEVARLRSSNSAIETNTRRAANTLTEVSGGSGTILVKAVA